MTLSSISNDQIVDLFAGPGGWSEGLKALGYSELGIEWDEAACLTARAAGHERLRADIAALNPRRLPCNCEHTAEEMEAACSPWHRYGCPSEMGEVWGLIASPPCQAWSMAGKGGGRRDVEHVIACAMEIAAGNDTRAEHAAKCEDARSMLVVEPLRWAKALEPEWIALEQVPPVLELWTLFAQILETWGYSTWAGVLEAERYGVPQTRERAVLMASNAKTVQPPTATHQRYVSGEPQRHDVTMLGEVLPWISMAEALGWDDGRAYRLARGEGMLERHGERRAVPKDEPAPVITSKARTAEWVLRAGTNANDVSRPVDAPAPTMRFGARANAVDWVPTHMAKKEDRPERVAQGAGNRPRSVETPAATLDTRTDLAHWVHDRPATTVNCDPRIAQPGHKGDMKKEPNAIRQMEGAVRVTVQEASILQSFRPDYPWQGSRTKQFEQVGNAVPPGLARAVLSQLVNSVASEEAA